MGATRRIPMRGFNHHWGPTGSKSRHSDLSVCLSHVYLDSIMTEKTKEIDDDDFVVAPAKHQRANTMH